MKFRIAALAMIALAFTAPVRAQDAPNQDWALVDAPERSAVIAVTSFDNGITLAGRCVNGVYDVTVAGLPPARGFSRIVRVSIGDEELKQETWTVGADATIAFSRLPAPFARRLAVGGRLQIAIPGTGGQRGTRYVMELPPSPTTLERTLTACGRSLVDPRDNDLDRDAPDGLSAGLDWALRPRLELPDSVRGRYVTHASVTVSCLVAGTGALTDCVIESEHPGGYGYGREVVRSLRSGRVRSLTPDITLGGQLVIFTVRFTDE
ncbi:MAG: hypothetical protein M3Q74_03865 [Pseudomonadota bacterium]|nr:hypothetical protein [Pseudomonadota bacterium]